MIDLPRLLPAFQRRFPDEPGAATYLAATPVAGGLSLPACGHDRGEELAPKVTAGRVMYGSKLPLTDWF